ncbi:MAG: hypothetical protein KME21_22960 [Desmonostoc vinosum HA7617-LM4]|jgi:hypothetical protein|nr:hypothetical protein [Desmonostoc vinosum HA7617-LM4]
MWNSLAELLKESGLVPLDTQGRVSSQGLYDSFEAADVLAKALAEENSESAFEISPKKA